MKTNKRFLLGLLSSLLLACGFVRAAGRFDPMSDLSSGVQVNSIAPDCDGLCWADTNGN